MSNHRAEAILPWLFLFLLVMLGGDPGILLGQDEATSPTSERSVSTDGEPATKSAKLVNFEQDVAPVLKQRCSECHLGDNAKGGLSLDGPDGLSSYIVSGDLAASALWTDYLLADPDQEESLLMPPMAKGGRLPAAELTLIKQWIEEGATWSLVSWSDKEQPIQPAQQNLVARSKSWPERLWAFQGYLHPATVHFPVALLIVGAGSLVCSYFAGKRAEDFAFFCLVLGTAGAIAASAMGWSFATEQGYPHWNIYPEKDQTIFWHRWLGVSLAVVGVVVVFLALLAKRWPKSNLKHLWKVGLMTMAALVSWVGHQGGELTYGEKHFDRAMEYLKP